jgi:hypothetical protein
MLGIFLLCNVYTLNNIKWLFKYYLNYYFIELKAYGPDWIDFYFRQGDRADHIKLKNTKTEKDRTMVRSGPVRIGLD